MVITMWSVKGGSGVSTLSTVVAAALNDLSRSNALLIDLADGDLRGILGGPTRASDDPGTGFGDWVAADETLDPSALERLIGSEPAPLLIGGNSASPIAQERSTRTVEGLRWLDTKYAHVLIDAGSANNDLSATTIQSATLSVLVLRPCLLSLRKAVASKLPASAAVLLAQPGSTLRASDIESSLGIPVITTIPFCASVSRATETSRLFSHPPRAIKRSIKPLLSLINEYQTP
jgi:hypothetical protein